MKRSTMGGVVLGAVAAVMFIPGPVLAQARPGSSATPGLPSTIPIFPLPDVTLFPNTTQPFHIFEPRYRDMIADALAGDSVIGMITLLPGFEAEYDGRPPVYAVGCAGVIVSSELLPDGRYDIVLRAVSKFRILAEDQSRSYRLAEVEAIPEAWDEADRPALGRSRRQLEAALVGAYPNAQLPPASVPDEQLIDGFSLLLPLEPPERQELLELDGPIARARWLIGFLGGGAQAQ